MVMVNRLNWKKVQTLHGPPIMWHSIKYLELAPHNISTVWAYTCVHTYTYKHLILFGCMRESMSAFAKKKKKMKKYRSTNVWTIYRRVVTYLACFPSLCINTFFFIHIYAYSSQHKFVCATISPTMLLATCHMLTRQHSYCVLTHALLVNNLQSSY